MELREYGLGNSETVGTSEWVPLEDPAAICANPECRGRVVEVRVRVKNHPFFQEDCWGYYLGCPACPYASPMLSVRDGSPVAVARQADWDRAQRRERHRAAAEKLLAACQEAAALGALLELGGPPYFLDTLAAAIKAAGE